MPRTTNLSIWIEQEVYDREGLCWAHNLLEVKFRKARKREFRVDSAMKADESKMRKNVIFVPEMSVAKKGCLWQIPTHNRERRFQG